MKHLVISICTQRKAQMHINVIQCTLNSTLAFENDLLSIPTCMVNLTFLQLDQNKSNYIEQYLYVPKCFSVLNVILKYIVSALDNTRI